MVVLIEKKKEGKELQREFEASNELAEKMLRKSKSWLIKDGEPFVFKDNKLIPKAKNKPEEKPKV